MLNLLSFVFLTLSLSTRANGASIGPSAVLVISNANISLDGYTRPAVLAGGTFPGPLIVGDKGDTFVIDVVDQLNDTSMDVVTSIHWHGIDQHTFNAFDGASFVNQCPIIPGDTFRYQFEVPSQAGTFWYHSHFSTQYCDGLRGALVVRDPQDPQAGLYDFDDDSTVITLADWYHYLSHNPPAGPPAFNSTLINGAGRWAGGPATPLSVVNVQQGKSYRFRLVSISCDPNWKFSIDDHTLTIIEVDGNNVQPLDVDQIQIFAGQRYSFVLNATQPVNNYWIRALPNRADDTTDNGVNSAILRYAGASDGDPTTLDTSGTLPLVETNLHVRPLLPGTHQPGSADRNITLDVTNNGTRFFVNNASFEDPSVPILLQILSGAQSVEDLVPAGSIYGLTRGDVVELTIPAGAVVGGPHPVHLHGHSFWVVRSAGNDTYNWDNPVVRDVVSLGEAESGSEVTIRFVADNPGPWFFHCHIDWHLAEGFAAVFAEDIPDIQSTDVTSDAWSALCPEYNAFINGTGA
ncbi:laccase C [Russula ochroleuca]|uniref:Laccase C n=1 Tax=Russula ochroleuca TaxID=152965 RepID=A0A9P5N3B7_9AGAM|nr:laccase C [Russula ochroleuca]